MLSILVDGEKQETIPEKSDYYQVEITCDQGTGEWDYKNWKATVKDFGYQTKCKVSFTTVEEPVKPNGKTIGMDLLYEGEDYKIASSFTIWIYPIIKRCILLLIVNRLFLLLILMKMMNLFLMILYLRGI